MPLLKTGKKYKLLFASVGWADIFLNSPRAPKGAKSVCIHKIRLTQHCRSKVTNRVLGYPIQRALYAGIENKSVPKPPRKELTNINTLQHP